MAGEWDVAGVGERARTRRWGRPATWARWQVDLLLGLVTLIWGGTFLTVQSSVRLIGPFEFLLLRFGLAALALALLFPRRLVRLTRRDLAAGALVGCLLFAGYGAQTLALQLTSSSKTGFLTGLNVVIVPVLAYVALRQRPGRRALAGVALATLGMALLSLNDALDWQVGPGEMLAVICAVCFAGHVVAISRFAPRADTVNLALVQIAVTAILSGVATPLHGEAFVAPPAAVWEAAAFLGIVATAFALLVMNGVQQFTSSAHAALIYALEPVFAGLFGYLAGETLSAPAWLGCGLIFTGMIAAEWRPGFFRRAARPPAG
jgi:drug/metabolite transporter (DMT)-like permease